MGRANTKIPINPPNLIKKDSSEFGFDSSLSDMVFGFLDHEYAERMQESRINSQESSAFPDEDEENENNGSAEEDKSFWSNQEQLLQATLCRTSSLESKIRNVTKEALKEIQMSGTICACGRPLVGGCRNCLMKEVSGRLQNSEFNSAICRSKWRSSPDIPSGEHTFIDVMDNSSTKKGEVRVIIELNFRAEFEMARASEDYNRLVQRLPEVFVGKIERLSNVIKILCLGAKKCMKEKKMHMGPWRKHRYMQAKWLKTCERITPSKQQLSMGYGTGRLQKPKASMLTVDLVDMLPNMHCAAVAVL
ncbi:hypothetical protein HS088_TW21G01242 [Tripterygium wilfordii]|uniref:Uncharacterized protein n=1 Tax=Tripterygium wilfordii TaxID=458696 RepID=A0A7J7C570_TRIWF|nr:uncharacterized protein LOC119989593 [Tripterygium wilfordii]KAF5729085.1 hypothetical protein HS088_TW21G01242 [Tripterygium wilfordii]